MTDGIPERLWRFKEETDSTSLRLKDDVLYADGPLFAVYCAARQTAGIGREGRRFYSAAEGIYFSVSFPFERTPPGLPLITLFSGLAVSNVLAPYLKVTPGIKWPNDLMVGEKKLCGILAQTVWRGGKPTVVLGVGVNTSAARSDLPEELRDKVTSFAIEGLTPPVPEAFVRDAVSALDRLVYAENVLEGALGGYLAELNRRNWLFGRTVARTLTDGSAVAGTAGRITENGGLLVSTADGETVQIEFGEIVPT